MQSATLTVRPRMSSDGAFIAALSAEAFARFSVEPARTVRRMLFEPHSRTFVAELDGEPVALAVLSITSVERGVVAHLDAIAVERRARGRGIGRRLIEHLADEARALGAGSLSLMTATANLAARRLFERTGFLTMATRRAAYRNGQRAVLMLKLL